MKKKSIILFSSLVLIGLVAVFFPSIKKFSEIRSETRKWNEKWLDHSKIPVDLGVPELGATGHVVPSDIKEDMVLGLAGSPWRIESTVIVHAGATVLVEPGVEVWIAPLADLQVFGRIMAGGTVDRTIHFRAYSNSLSAAWAGMFFRSDVLSEFNHVVFENSQYGAKGVFATVEWNQCVFKNVREICSGFRSRFVYDGCLFDYRDYDGSGNINVMKFYRGFARIENSEFFCPNSDNKVDGIDADYMDQAIIRGNRIWAGECPNSDAIDLGHGSRDILIENNLIVGFMDKGISVGEKAHALIHNNVIANCSMGVGVKDSASAVITNTTFYRNAHAVECYEKVPGLGGGHVEVDRSITVESRIAPQRIDALSEARYTNTLCDQELLEGAHNVQGSVVFEDAEAFNFKVKEVRDASGSLLPPLDGWGATL